MSICLFESELPARFVVLTGGMVITTEIAADQPTDFLVIGAGLAGLTCARDLHEAGRSVRLLDKGRGVGGRCATRRVGDTRVDHGAQYFTARGERLRSWVEEAQKDGWLSVWCNGFPLWKEGIIHHREPGHPRYAPHAGMSELAKRLANGLDIRTGATVRAITRDVEGIYRATTEEGAEFSGRSLILNLPPRQLLNIAGDVLSPKAKVRIDTVGFWPAWALILRLAEDIPGADWPALEFEGHPILYWVARDHTRRSPGSSPTLIVHADGPWSVTNLEEEPSIVEGEIKNALTHIVGPLSILESQLHRWRYAKPVTPLPEKHLWDVERRIGACGDWCGGPRVEGALESGWSLAGTVLAE